MKHLLDFNQFILEGKKQKAKKKSDWKPINVEEEIGDKVPPAETPDTLKGSISCQPGNIPTSNVVAIM